MTTTTSEAIASTIRKQIGTDAWLAVSAREAYITTDNNVTLTFRFGSNRGLPHYCEITYKRGSDDYTILAYRVHRNGCKRALANYEGVYADSLGFLIRDINREAEFA